MRGEVALELRHIRGDVRHRLSICSFVWILEYTSVFVYVKEAYTENISLDLLIMKARVLI